MPLATSFWHPGHVFFEASRRGGGATVAGTAAFARLLGGSPPFFLRGGMLPDLVLMYATQNGDFTCKLACLSQAQRQRYFFVLVYRHTRLPS